MADGEARVSGRIFISYRREETAYPAGWLADRLTERFGRGSVFKDVDSIAFGDDFTTAIARAVGSCDVLLALIGPRWIAATDEHGRRRLDLPDDFVRREIETALARNVRVIPILVDGARMPAAKELPPRLAPLAVRQALDINPSRFASDTARLITVLETTLREQRSLGAAPDPAAPASRNRRGIVLGVGAVAVLVAAAVVVVLSQSAGRGSGGTAAATTATGPVVVPTAQAAATTPPPADAQGPVLLTDDFSSDTTGWRALGPPATSGKIVDGSYRFRLPAQPGGTGSGAFPEHAGGAYPNAPADVVIEATITRLSTSPMDAGLMCRANEDPGYGYFLVLSQGAAEINKSSADTPFEPLKSTPLPFDAAGPHRLKAECRDDVGGVHLTLTVDGQQLVDVVDRRNPLTEGCVGLWMGLGDGARDAAVAQYDDVTVRG
jgi:TIR domain